MLYPLFLACTPILLQFARCLGMGIGNGGPPAEKEAFVLDPLRRGFRVRRDLAG